MPTGVRPPRDGAPGPTTTCVEVEVPGLSRRHRARGRSDRGGRAGPRVRPHRDARCRPPARPAAFPTSYAFRDRVARRLGAGGPARGAACSRSPRATISRCAATWTRCRSRTRSKPTRGSCGRGSRRGSCTPSRGTRRAGATAIAIFETGTVFRLGRTRARSDRRSRSRSSGPPGDGWAAERRALRRARRQGGPRDADGGGSACASWSLGDALDRPFHPGGPRRSSSARRVPAYGRRAASRGPRRLSRSRGGSAVGELDVAALLAGDGQGVRRPRRPAVPARPARPGVRRRRGRRRRARSSARWRRRRASCLSECVLFDVFRGGSLARGHQEPRLRAGLPGARPHAHRARRPTPSSTAIVARLATDFGAELRAG